MRNRAVWGITAAYGVLYTALGIVRYGAHRNFVDFGIFAQTAASAFGCFCNTVEGSHWAFHFSPFLYLVGVLVVAVHSPVTLIALQAVAGALVIPPVAAIVAKREGHEKFLWLVALVVFLYPALGGLTFNDFHENGFAPAAVAWMLWAFDAGRLRLTIVFAAVLLCIKEDQGLFLAVAGGLAAWRFRGTRPGLAAGAIAIAGLGVYIVYFSLIQPHAAAQAHWAPTRFYAWTIADFNSGLIAGLLARAGFIVLAFLPLLFLPFRSRMMWLAAAPLAEVLLSRMPTTYTLGSHYAGAWIGYVLVAFAFALRALPQQRALIALRWCAILCVVELAAANPLHPGLNLRLPQARDVQLDTTLAALPHDGAIATQEEAYTHLALGNPNARPLPEDATAPPPCCMLLLDRAFPDSPRLMEYGPAIAQLVRDGTYRLEQRNGDIEIYTRAK